MIDHPFRVIKDQAGGLSAMYHLLDIDHEMGGKGSLFTTRFTITPLEGMCHIFCDCDRFKIHQWCVHVTRLYSDNLDAAPHCDVKRRIGYAPLVTIFNNPCLVIHMGLVPVQNHDSLHEVHVFWGGVRVDPDNGEIHSKGGEHIGFLDPEIEGRGTMRGLFLEWIPSKFTDNNLECTSRWHTDGSRVLAVEAASLLQALAQPTTLALEVEQTNRKHIQNVYHTLDTGHCVSCQVF